MEQIDWMTKTAATMRGLPPNAVSTSTASGASKTIDSWEMMELRADDIEYLRLFESELFEITRIVWNYNSPDKIDVDAVFGIDFVLPKPPTPEIEQIQAKQMKMVLGLWTPVEDFIDEDAGIDEKAALDYVKHNLEILEELGLEAEKGSSPDNRTPVGAGGTETSAGRPRSRDDSLRLDYDEGSPE
jgi:hypothetical protein